MANPAISTDERREFLELLALPPGARLFEPKGIALDADDGSVDGILCIDSIASLPDRAAALAEWARVLKPGGRALYTDPAIVAGLVTSDEIAARSGAGLLVLSAQGENESLIEGAGFRLLRADDATDAIADQVQRERDRREANKDSLVATEGRARFEVTQRRLETAYRLAADRRLVRIAFLIEKLA